MARSCIHEGVTAHRLLPALVVCALNAFSSATLTPEASGAFDRYVQLAEAARNRAPEALPGAAQLRSGEVTIEPGVAPQQIKIPGAMIHDWVGAVYIPNTTIQQVKAVLQDYDNYKHFYQPEVIESKQLAHQGDEYDIFLRLRKHQVLTVVLNTEYRVRYIFPDPRRMQVISRSTRIAEVKDSDRSLTIEKPVGSDNGFLWRLNSYWRFEEADGGVYAECRAISLSRDVPMGLGWMIRGFVSKFPKESMQNTLRGTKAAVEHHSSL